MTSRTEYHWSSVKGTFGSAHRSLWQNKIWSINTVSLKELFHFKVSHFI